MRQHLRTVSVPLSILDDLMNMLFLSFFFLCIHSAHKDSGPPMWQILLVGNLYKDNSMNYCDWTKNWWESRRHLILSLILSEITALCLKLISRPGGDIKMKSTTHPLTERHSLLKELKCELILVNSLQKEIKARKRLSRVRTEYEFGGERSPPSVSGCGSLFHLPYSFMKLIP